jgi:hypothetical protein
MPREIRLTPAPLRFAACIESEGRLRSRQTVCLIVWPVLLTPLRLNQPRGRIVWHVLHSSLISLPSIRLIGQEA